MLSGIEGEKNNPRFSPMPRRAREMRPKMYFLLADDKSLQMFLAGYFIGASDRWPRLEKENGFLVAGRSAIGPPMGRETPPAVALRKLTYRFFAAEKREWGHNSSELMHCKAG